METTWCQERRVGCERRVLGLGPQRQESGYGEGVPLERTLGARFRTGKAEECTWRRWGASREKSWLRQLGARFIARDAEECLRRGWGARREELAAKEGGSV